MPGDPCVLHASDSEIAIELISLAGTNMLGLSPRKGEETIPTWRNTRGPNSRAFPKGASS
jgi:hypothetical protein